MPHLDRDPWVDVKTFNGFQADHVISALQKRSAAATRKTRHFWRMK